MAIISNRLDAGYTFDPQGHFRSHQEMTAAMSSARYAQDEAYRDEVAAKLGRTDRTTWNLSETRQVNFVRRSVALASTEGFAK